MNFWLFLGYLAFPSSSFFLLLVHFSEQGLRLDDLSTLPNNSPILQFLLGQQEICPSAAEPNPVFILGYRVAFESILIYSTDYNLT